VYSELAKAIRKNQASFEIEVPEDKIERLANYYDLIQEHNPILHLVAPCSPEEFAIRHILESLTLSAYLPKNARFADIGTGAGLPSIPCLIFRDDLRAVLIESKEKKTRFLEIATEKLELAKRAQIVNKQFEEVVEKDFSYVTCRALDKFTEKLPRLIKWARGSRLLLFGGPGLESEFKKFKFAHEKKLLPLSEQRYLFRISSKR